MAVFRVERNKGYTVMSNHHLRNKELSLKAKGLLSQMLSLPEDWDYTLKGLSLINREKWERQGFLETTEGDVIHYGFIERFIEELVLERNVAHGGHPVLRWMMDNIFVRTDPAGNIKPDKERATEKIDGAVAAVMVLDRAVRNGGGTGSVYDERGSLSF